MSSPALVHLRRVRLVHSTTVVDAHGRVEDESTSRVWPPVDWFLVYLTLGELVYIRHSGARL